MMGLGMMMSMTWVLYGLIPVLPIIYIILRWRQSREGGASDPQLGRKTVLYYFATIGLQIVLAAVGILLFSLLTDANEMAMRLTGGLLLGGGVLLGLHKKMLSNSNTEQFPNAQRMYIGINMVVSGLTMSAGLLLTCVLLLQESNLSAGADLIELGITLMVVYGPAYWLFNSRLD